MTWKDVKTLFKGQELCQGDLKPNDMKCHSGISNFRIQTTEWALRWQCLKIFLLPLFDCDSLQSGHVIRNGCCKVYSENALFHTNSGLFWFVNKHAGITAIVNQMSTVFYNAGISGGSSGWTWHLDRWYEWSYKRLYNIRPNKVNFQFLVFTHITFTGPASLKERKKVTSQHLFCWQHTCSLFALLIWQNH